MQRYSVDFDTPSALYISGMKFRWFATSVETIPNLSGEETLSKTAWGTRMSA